MVPRHVDPCCSIDAPRAVEWVLVLWTHSAPYVSDFVQARRTIVLRGFEPDGVRGRGGPSSMFAGTVVILASLELRGPVGLDVEEEAKTPDEKSVHVAVRSVSEPILDHRNQQHHGHPAGLEPTPHHPFSLVASPHRGPGPYFELGSHRLTAETGITHAGWRCALPVTACRNTSRTVA